MEKKKLSLKKETIEVLNQNEMSEVYGGVATDTCTGLMNVCNTIEGCDSLQCSMEADGCLKTLNNCGGGNETVRPYIPLTNGCEPVFRNTYVDCQPQEFLPTPSVIECENQNL